MFSKYAIIVLGILLLVAIGAATLAGHLYRAELIAHQATKDALAEQKAEVKEQKLQNAELQAQAKAQNETAQLLIQEMRDRDAQHQADLRRINAQRASAQAAILAHPERFGAIATFDLRRSMRDVCRSGAGDAATCHIEPVRPAKAGPGPTDQPDPDGDHAGNNGGVE